MPSEKPIATPPAIPGGDPREEVTVVATPPPEVTNPPTATGTSPSEDAAPKKRPRRPKVPWRQRVSLATLLLWTVLFSIVGAGFASGYYGYQVLYENKLTDTWADLRRHPIPLAISFRDSESRRPTWADPSHRGFPW